MRHFAHALVLGLLAALAAGRIATAQPATQAPAQVNPRVNAQADAQADAQPNAPANAGAGGRQADQDNAQARAQEPGGVSNPLWSIPLDQLAAARERPLFTRDRRPPETDAPPPAPEAAPAAVGPDAPPFTLLGTVVGAHERIAVVMETQSQQVLRLPVGETAQGWRVAAVEARSATLARGPRSVKLELPKPALR